MHILQPSLLMTNMNKYYAQDLAVATAARLNCLALFQLSLTRNLIQGANLTYIKDLKVSQ